LLTCAFACLLLQIMIYNSLVYILAVFSIGFAWFPGYRYFHLKGERKAPRQVDCVLGLIGVELRHA